MKRYLHFVVLTAIIGSFALVAAFAMRHNSTTFDEILLPSAGARGFVTGDFTTVMDHPRLLQYAYGLPIYLSGVKYPSESARDWDYDLRYVYARDFYFRAGNDPERLAFRARLVGVAIGALLLLAVFLITSRIAGAGPALLATGLTASMPDVLAHSGVTYNDVPLALAVLVATWLLDRAVRKPAWQNVAIAALASGLTIGVKFSGLVVGLILLALLLVEAVAGRWHDRQWRQDIARAIPVYIAVLYLTLVAVYLGDFQLVEFREGLAFNIRHAAIGHATSAVLLGNHSVAGWWYFFPVAFFLKTSVALHALMLLALGGLIAAIRTSGAAGMMRGKSRAIAVGGILFLASVMMTNLNIGFRHALPLLPFVCILTAVGVCKLWGRSSRLIRATIILLIAMNSALTLRHYPYFLSYLSEYTEGKVQSYETLSDSSLDWGQGLIALREFMRSNDIDQVYLSYFGTGAPEVYGIDYVRLPSFFELPYHPLDPRNPPRFIAVSATILAGGYINGRFFEALRNTEPVAIVGGSIWIFPVQQQPR